MKNIYVKDILEVTNGELIIGKLDTKCEVFSKDTRKINENDVYIGFKGEKFDGNTLWKEALEKGASVAIVENIDFSNADLSGLKNKTIIKVKSTLDALCNIAKYKRNLYDIPVVGVTGSVGKTSTKDIIASVISKKFKTLKTEGNNNNDIGLPFTLLRLRDEEAAVIEMGMNHLGEISKLTNIAKPSICVITNIGTSHIGNLGSRENILKAKLEILEGNENPTVIINNDNDLLHNWYQENKDKYNIITYGIENKSNIMAKNIILYKENSEFDCVAEDKTIAHIKVPVGGEHFVLNSLCAYAVGRALEIETEKICDGIGSFELTKKRMDIVELKNGVKIINDSYNASFESMKASLKYLSEFKENRKIAVLGDMFELGEFSTKLHQDVGKEVYKNNIDILICSGENAKHIVKSAENSGMKKENIFFFKEKEEIVNFLKENIEKGDIILFKASNGMKFFDLAQELINNY